MKVKVEFEFDLDDFEEWCQIKFTEEDIENIKEFLSDEMIMAYALRDFINDGLRD